MSLLRSALLACLLVLLPLTIFAQSGAPLEEGEVRRFLATLVELEELGERYEDADFEAIDPDPEAGFSPLASSLKELRGHEAYPEFQEILQAEGFEDEDRWAEVGDRTLRAYMALQIQDEHPEMLSELSAALNEIENHPDMNREQRKLMLEMMGPALAIARSIEEVPEEDLRLTESMRGEIDAVVE